MSLQGRAAATAHDNILYLQVLSDQFAICLLSIINIIFIEQVFHKHHDNSVGGDDPDASEHVALHGAAGSLPLMGTS